MRIILSAVAALGLIAAAPSSSSAQTFARYGYDPQGGGGAGPYDLRCQRYRNFNMRERCTTAMIWRHRYGYYRHHHYGRRAER